MDTCCLILSLITFEEGHIKLLYDLLHQMHPIVFITKPQMNRFGSWESYNKPNDTHEKIISSIFHKFVRIMFPTS
jgi:hypothetical protein